MGRLLYVRVRSTCLCASTRAKFHSHLVIGMTLGFELVEGELDLLMLDENSEICYLVVRSATMYVMLGETSINQTI